MSSISDPEIQTLQDKWEQTSLEDSGALNPVDALSADRFVVKTVSDEVPDE